MKSYFLKTITVGSCSEKHFTSEYLKVLYRSDISERREKPWLDGRSRFIIKISFFLALS